MSVCASIQLEIQSPENTTKITDLMFLPKTVFHLKCYTTIISKLQEFEILKWAQGSQWRKQRTSNFNREIQLFIFSRM